MLFVSEYFTNLIKFTCHLLTIMHMHLQEKHQKYLDIDFHQVAPKGHEKAMKMVLPDMFFYGLTGARGSPWKTWPSLLSRPWSPISKKIVEGFKLLRVVW